jgi:hypothetical protein
MGDEEARPPPRRDPRVAGLDRDRFTKTASEVLAMFDDKKLAGHGMLTRSGALDAGHRLAGPTGVGGGKPDPLKKAAAKFCGADGVDKVGSRRAKTYKEQRDKLSEVYSQYLDLDLSMKEKQLRGRARKGY